MIRSKQRNLMNRSVVRRRNLRRLLPFETLETRTVLSGISLVDHDPHAADLTGHEHAHVYQEVGYYHDSLGNSLHILPAPVEGFEPTTSESGELTLGAELTLADTFRLHSNPGASHTIYLDFDGHVTSGTIWNSRFNDGEDIVTPAYSFTGDSSFTDSELARIQAIWQRVAEDFIPFDVNVTTEEPSLEALEKSGSGDTEWGVRVVIGGDGSWFSDSKFGGVAYVGSFNWSSDTPVFVFEDNLGNGNEKYTAEAISHEVGHALGLNHDGRTSPSEEYYAGHGSGETGWAPIMGVGYYRALTQWSRGEYANASNTEDDLAIITTQNGFGYRADDHGDDFDSASVLTVDQGSVFASGIIERNDDVDMFTFLTGSGTVDLDFLPAPRGPNLDIAAALFDAVGTLLVYSNPIGSLAAGISANLPAGQYFVQVSGVGEGDPLDGGYSDYGSLGSYTIVGTVVQTEAVYLSLSAVDADKPEGDSGTTEFIFAVNRSGNTELVTEVDWSVTGSGVSPADENDFVGGVLPSGTVSFAAGETHKTIIVPVAGDLEVEPDEQFTVTLSSPAAETLITQATAVGVIRNDDTPVIPAGITVTPTSGLTTTESGGSDSFSVVLDTAPTADVVIAIASSDTTEGVVDKSSLTFTAENWSVPQVVTVTGVDDDVRDGNIEYVIYVGPAVSLDERYDGLDPDNVRVTNMDNNRPGNGNGGGGGGGQRGPKKSLGAAPVSETSPVTEPHRDSGKGATEKPLMDDLPPGLEALDDRILEKSKVALEAIQNRGGKGEAINSPAREAIDRWLAEWEADSGSMDAERLAMIGPMLRL